MTTLKQAIEEIHKEAEQTPWSQLLISGNIDENQWFYYVCNMCVIFEAIEKRNVILNKDVLRTSLLRNEINNTQPICTNETKLYLNYLEKLSDDLILAHVYTHYLAFLYGGQYISKKLKWKTDIFEFNNIKNCITYLRDLTKDVDHKEAINAFQWTIRVYNNLWNNYH